MKRNISWILSFWFFGRFLIFKFKSTSTQLFSIMLEKKYILKQFQLEYIQPQTVVYKYEQD